jgi:hypothetical protein
MDRWAIRPRLKAGLGRHRARPVGLWANGRRGVVPDYASAPGSVPGGPDAIYATSVRRRGRDRAADRLW